MPRLTVKVTRSRQGGLRDVLRHNVPENFGGNKSLFVPRTIELTVPFES